VGRTAVLDAVAKRENPFIFHAGNLLALHYWQWRFLRKNRFNYSAVIKRPSGHFKGLNISHLGKFFINSDRYLPSLTAMHL
jgi:hypothetical protein